MHRECHCSKLSVASIGGKPTVKNTKGEAVGDVKKIDLAAHCGEVWQFSMPMKPGKYECFGFDGTQVILCPDAETAKRIKGSVETASDGTLYPHKFQVKIHDWIQNAKKTNLKMETVEENILHRPEYRFFIVRESIVAGFLDTVPDRFGFGRQVGVPARHQEQFP